ncbi:hypothetical protein GTR02_09000, partial [Kineococcus sp. R8]|uniref:hypothetical protein n=1 Tax=Kineococcus siccus TaxID=2696567 RepID=UPI001412C960
MMTFVVLAVVGGGLCLLSFVLDGVFEALDVDIAGGFLSLTSLSGAVALFGLSGFLAVDTLGWSGGRAALLGSAVALVTLVAVGSLVRVLRREEPETSTTIVGARGHVTTRVPAGGYGEVHLVLAGTTVKRTATAAAPLDRGTPVQVLAELSATAVRVSPLEL